MTTSASRLSSSATCRLAVVSYLVATASSFSVLIERTNLLPSSAVAFSTTARSTCFVPKRPLQMSSPDSDGESFDLSKLGDEDFVALKLIVSGNIGGYYRACIKNEAERFRGLGGSMTDTDEDGKAEINVEVRDSVRLQRKITRRNGQFFLPRRRPIARFPSLHLLAFWRACICVSV